MNAFVWTKMGVESGMGLEQIVQSKEEQRISGRGEFWWGIGNSLGAKACECARAQGGTLPVLFSMMRARPKPIDESPDMVWRWTQWEDEHGQVHDVPSYATVISRGAVAKKKHYALVCQSDTPLALERGGAKFDPNLCHALSGKIPGASQVTALLFGLSNGHLEGQYEICFRAKLVAPWVVKLVRPILN
jgi:hypothetical protein